MEPSQPDPKQPWIDSWYVELAAVVLGIIGSCLIYRYIGEYVDALLSSDEAAVYGAITGLQGAFLGFVLAALTIVLGYSHSPELKLLKDSKQLRTLLFVYVAGIRSHAVSTVVALVALLMNPGTFLGPVMAWIVGTTCLLAFLRLFRTLWATRAVVMHIASAGPRKAGQA